MGRAFFWTFSILEAVGIFWYVATVGKPRKPVEPLDAALLVVINLAWIAWAAYETGLLNG